MTACEQRSGVFCSVHVIEMPVTVPVERSFAAAVTAFSDMHINICRLAAKLKTSRQLRYCSH